MRIWYDRGRARAVLKQTFTLPDEEWGVVALFLAWLGLLALLIPRLVNCWRVAPNKDGVA